MNLNEELFVSIDFKKYMLNWKKIEVCNELINAVSIS